MYYDRYNSEFDRESDEDYNNHRSGRLRLRRSTRIAVEREEPVLTSRQRNLQNNERSLRRQRRGVNRGDSSDEEEIDDVVMEEFEE